LDSLAPPAARQEGGKCRGGRVLAAVGDAGATAGLLLPWLVYAPVDVSLPLLVEAHRAAAPITTRRPHWAVAPMCDDFESGPLSFLTGLPTGRPDGPRGRRLVLLLGNVFGNLCDEDEFVSRQLGRVARPGDWVWLELGVRHGSAAEDPLSWTPPSPNCEGA
jgi:uncharacterized SAM-dependent methyltransferase